LFSQPQLAKPFKQHSKFTATLTAGGKISSYAITRVDFKQCRTESRGKIVIGGAYLHKEKCFFFFFYTKWRLGGRGLNIPNPSNR